MVVRVMKLGVVSPGFCCIPKRCNLWLSVNFSKNECQQISTYYTFFLFNWKAVGVLRNYSF